MSDEEEIYFVDSSDEEGDLAASMGLSHRATAAGRQEPTPLAGRSPQLPRRSKHPSTQGLSMEDVLFERQRPPGLELLGRGGGPGSPSAAHARTAPDLDQEVNRCPVALEMLSGASVNVLPRRAQPLEPRSLAHLRGMTSSEVRETLEPFFLRKEAAERAFRAEEAAIAEKAASDRAAGVTQDLPTIRRRDRCSRLVNVNGWGDGSDSANDVLLPASLVSSSAYYTEQSTRGTSGDETSRTLRQHQIEGIRFMWHVLHEGPVGQVPAVGCILAHTMGLGKTAQVVLLIHLFAAANGSVTADRTQAPPLPRVLIVTPKSTLSVWQREFSSWSTAFPPRARLTPITLEAGGGTSGASESGSPAAHSPSKRLQRFKDWRRKGGVLLIGYEALVRLMQLVEEEHMFSGSGSGAEETSGYRGGLREQKGEHQRGAGLRDPVRRHLAAARRHDEGGLAYGGADDPFTELLVCDEAHRLKSVHLQVVTALRGLHPLRRLLLTGTPLQNHLSEYWAMIDFAVHKYFDRSRFKTFFVHSIESSINKTASRQQVALARKKTFTLINEVKHFVQRVDSAPLKAELPALHEYVVVVPLSNLQRSIYCKFVELIPHLYGAKGGGFQFLPAVSFAGKIASHPQLLFDMRNRLASGGRPLAKTGSTVRRTGQPHGAAANGNSTAAQEKTAVPSHDSPRAPQHRRGGRRKARRGRRSFSSEDSLLSESADSASDAVGRSDSDSSSRSSSDRDDEEDDNSDAIDDEAEARAARASFSQLYESSTDYDGLCEPPPNYTPRLEDGVKLHVAMGIIQASIRKGEKTLLFSLSTRLLDFFEQLVAQANMSRDTALDRFPIRYCRLDGSHTGAQRASMLSDFHSEAAGYNLFLLSMKAGGVGVTITAATRVILVDSSFNPADDQQAIGRAYRYGQTKPVYVYRLLCHQTLEYSIFEQKLAKDWLFKTVVEETSMKRDGLAGMHLREIFSLLDRAAKAMKRAPTITRGQTQATDAIAKEDDVLAAVRARVLYAQRYSVFLAQDAEERYGAEEEKYYERYRRDRLFDVGANVLPADVLAEQLSHRKRQREQQEQHLAANAQSLTAMVDRLVQSHAATDPHLAHLLSVMGLRVNPVTGQVQNAPERDRTSTATITPSPQGGPRRRETVARETSGLTIPDSSASSALDDADEEEDLALVLTASRGVDVDPSRGGIVVDPSKYEPYRPGGTLPNAIDVDSD